MGAIHRKLFNYFACYLGIQLSCTAYFTHRQTRAASISFSFGDMEMSLARWNRLKCSLPSMVLLSMQSSLNKMLPELWYQFFERFCVLSHSRHRCSRRGGSSNRNSDLLFKSHSDTSFFVILVLTMTESIKAHDNRQNSILIRQAFLFWPLLKKPK